MAPELNAKRQATNAGAADLLKTIRIDPRFAAIRNMPEFQKMVQ